MFKSTSVSCPLKEITALFGTRKVLRKENREENREEKW